MANLHVRLHNCLLLVALVLVSLAAPDFQSSASAANPRPNARALKRVMEVQNSHTKALLAQKGVVGTATGISNGRPVIFVFVKLRSHARNLPRVLQRVSVVPVVTGGAFYSKPRPDNPGNGNGNGGGGGNNGGDKVDPKTRFARPVPIGVSTGNAGQCSSGTIGCRVIKDGKFFALSNNHVYALTNGAPLGSNILQPGRVDVSCALNGADVIGTLSEFEPIKFDGSGNTIDAAISLSSTTDLGDATPSDGYGKPKTMILDPISALGRNVQKYGRSTGMTKGVVTAINAAVNVTYGSGKVGLFVGQIIIEKTKGPFLKSGDSGSLAVVRGGKDDRKPVGLIFAGTSSGSLAVANPIDAVLTRFSVTIDGE